MQLSTHIWPSPLLWEPSEEAAATDFTNGLAAYWLSGTETNLPTEWDESRDFVLQLTPVNTPVESASGQGKFVDKSGVFQETGTDYMHRTDEAALRVAAEMTFAVWVYFTPDTGFTAGNRSVFSKQTLSTAPEMQLRLDYDFVSAFTATFQVTSGTTKRTVTSGVVPLSQWVLLTCYYSESEGVIGIIVNSTVSESSATSTVSAPGVTGRWYVGASSDAAVPGNPYEGRLQQLARWDRLLTTDEKAALLTDSLANLIDSEPAATGITDEEGTVTDDDGPLTDDET